jgi:hypothetical protein
MYVRLIATYTAFLPQFMETVLRPPSHRQQSLPVLELRVFFHRDDNCTVDDDRRNTRQIDETAASHLSV